ncbi:MAG: hypothetical protein AAGB11_01375 [Pseudomonadota bacterium]
MTAVDLRGGLKNVVLHIMKKQQKNVDNYYNEPGKANMSAGGNLDATKNRTDKIMTDKIPTNRNEDEAWNREIFSAQMDLFKHGYDERKFHAESEKCLSRAEYAARICQIAESDQKSISSYLLHGLGVRNS